MTSKRADGRGHRPKQGTRRSLILSDELLAAAVELRKRNPKWSEADALRHMMWRGAERDGLLVRAPAPTPEVEE